MGQQCCAASQNTPEIIITEQNESRTKGDQLNKNSEEQKLKEKKENSQKNNFYGKDGHVYSKTVTKQMTSSIDHKLDQYKKMIFQKQQTITQLPQEDSGLQPPQPPKKQGKQDRVKREQDVVGQFLGEMAFQISSAADE